jgi:hypothetical protein
MKCFAFGALLALALAALPVAAQDAAGKAPSPYLSVTGSITKVDTAAKVVSVKTDKGDTTVKFDDKTQFQALGPGETDLTKATTIKPEELTAGDRILARVRTSDPTGLPATRAIINRQADIAKRDANTLEAWRTQSVSGLVGGVDTGAKTITMKVRGATPAAPVRDVVVDVSGKVTYERFSADTGKYESSDMAAVRQGDQIRVLGEKNADITAVKASAMQTGAFATIPAQIKSVEAGTMEVSATNPATKKPVTITVRNFTVMKRLDDNVALMLARRLNPTFQGGAGGRGGAGRGGDAAPAGGGGPGGGRGGRGGATADPARIIEQQPTIQLADLKAGEPLIITGIASADGAKITAISLTAGVDPILRAAPNNGPDPLGGGWNFGDVSGGGPGQ